MVSESVPPSPGAPESALAKPERSPEPFLHLWGPKPALDGRVHRGWVSVAIPGDLAPVLAKYDLVVARRTEDFGHQGIAHRRQVMRRREVHQPGGQRRVFVDDAAPKTPDQRIR